MFDISHNFQRGPDYLLQNFIAQQEGGYLPEPPITAPAPTMDVRQKSTVHSGRESSAEMC